MTTQDKDRLECAIRHIKTAVDVDPWAVEIAVEAMEKMMAQPVDEDINVPCKDAISRRAALDCFHDWIDEHGDVYTPDDMPEYRAIEELPSVQPEIVRCKDCEFGEQDEVGRWFCRSLGCQIGNEDGSGYCADAERRTDDKR